jgi:hypothetical protein
MLHQHCAFKKYPADGRLTGPEAPAPATSGTIPVLAALRFELQWQRRTP